MGLIKRIYQPGIITELNGMNSMQLATDLGKLEKTAEEFAYTYSPELLLAIEQEKQKYNPDEEILVVLIALGAGEYYSCFLEGTPVMLESGWQVPIEDIEEGDKVITHTGKTGVVKATLDSFYEGDIYTFKFYSWGLELTSTEHHPIYGVKKEDLYAARSKYYKQKETYEEFIRKLDYIFMEAKEIEVGDYVAVPYPTETKPIDELKDEDFAYLLGWYLAEGSVAKDYTDPGQYYTKVILTLGSHEKAAIKRIVEIVEKNGYKAHIKEIPETSSVRIEIGWVDYVNACVKHLGRGSKHKYISNDILKMPDSWLESFFDAYMDGDGNQVRTRSATAYYGNLRSSTVSHNVALGLVKLSAKLGYESTYFKCKQHDTVQYSPGSTIYEVSFDKVMSKYLTGERFFEAKKAASRRSIYLDKERGYILVPVKEITKQEYRGMVYNLHVEEDNSYVVNGFAVHNSNVNGDFFYEHTLKKIYKTFEAGHIFELHQNKDISRALGRIPYAFYNEKMHRVELLIAPNRTKAAGWVNMIEAGKPVDVSFGYRTPYDRCSICGNEAHSRAEYCIHLKYQMNEVLDDGRKVYAINPDVGRFFEISFVRKGAVPIAKVMEKVASTDSVFIGSSVEDEYDIYRHSRPPLHKTAGTKTAAVKLAELVKEVENNLSESGIDPKILYVISDLIAKKRRKPVPLDIDVLKEYKLEEVLGTLGAAGIIPSLQEFAALLLNTQYNIRNTMTNIQQLLVQIRNGLESLGADVWSDSTVGKYVEHDPFPVNPNLLEYLSRTGMLTDRSWLPPFVVQRELLDMQVTPDRVSDARGEELEKNSSDLTALLESAAVAQLYSEYLNKIGPSKLSRLDSLIAKKPEIAAAILYSLAQIPNIFRAPTIEYYYNPDLINENNIVKTSSIGGTLMKGILPGFLASAYFRQKQDLNEQIYGRRTSGSKIGDFLANHPVLSIAGGFFSYKALSKLLEKGFSIGKADPKTWIKGASVNADVLELTEEETMLATIAKMAGENFDVNCKKIVIIQEGK